MLADARDCQSVAANAKDVADPSVAGRQGSAKITDEVEQLRSQRDAVEADATNVEQRSRRAREVPSRDRHRTAAGSIPGRRHEDRERRESHQTAVGAEEQLEARKEAAERSEAAVNGGT